MILMILAIAAIVLIQISVSDLLDFRIRNEAVAVLVVLYFVYAAISGDWRSVPGHAVFALAMIAVLIIPYAFGRIGGGDVKMLFAAFLWTGLQCALPFAVVLLLATSLHYVLGRFGVATLKSTAQGTSLPFGPSIAAALAATVVLAGLDARP